MCNGLTELAKGMCNGLTELAKAMCNGLTELAKAMCNGLTELAKAMVVYSEMFRPWKRQHRKERKLQALGKRDWHS